MLETAKAAPRIFKFHPLGHPRKISNRRGEEGTTFLRQINPMLPLARQNELPSVATLRHKVRTVRNHHPRHCPCLFAQHRLHSSALQPNTYKQGSGTLAHRPSQAQMSARQSQCPKIIGKCRAFPPKLLRGNLDWVMQNLQKPQGGRPSPALRFARYTAGRNGVKQEPFFSPKDEC